MSNGLFKSSLYFVTINFRDPNEQLKAEEQEAEMTMRILLKLVSQHKVLEEIKKENIEAITPIIGLMEKLPEFFITHYIKRLKLRVQYHFTLEKQTNKAERPELILNYMFDQIRVFKKYIDDLDLLPAFIVLKDRILDEIMTILIERYNEISDKLKENIRVFFVYLEEVSLFQARLYNCFDYACSEKYSLFFKILVNLCDAIFCRMERSTRSRYLIFGRPLTANSPKNVSQKYANASLNFR